VSPDLAATPNLTYRLLRRHGYRDDPAVDDGRENGLFASVGEDDEEICGGQADRPGGRRTTLVFRVRDERSNRSGA